MGRVERIAKQVVARSQIFKKCVKSGGLCNMHIDESICLEEKTYDYPKLVADVDGFAFDVEREMNAVCGLHCDKGLIHFGIDHGNDLLLLSYDFMVPADDATVEKIRMNEWMLEEK